MSLIFLSLDKTLIMSLTSRTRATDRSSAQNVYRAFRKLQRCSSTNEDIHKKVSSSAVSSKLGCE